MAVGRGGRGVKVSRFDAKGSAKQRVRAKALRNLETFTGNDGVDDDGDDGGGC